jgi:hypothetical protein
MSSIQSSTLISFNLNSNNFKFFRKEFVRRHLGLREVRVSHQKVYAKNTGCGKSGDGQLLTCLHINFNVAMNSYCTIYLDKLKLFYDQKAILSLVLIL